MQHTDAGLLFAALANSDRLAMIDALLDRDAPGTGLSISQVAEAAEVSRFTASRGLAILRAAGLVNEERCGGVYRHWIELEAIIAIEDWAYSKTSRNGERSSAIQLD